MDLLDVLGVRWKGSPWVRCVVREPHECGECGEPLPKGSTALRPLSGSADRWSRICVNCALSIAKRGGT